VRGSGFERKARGKRRGPGASRKGRAPAVGD
jgi:hypothetical protein